MGGGHVGGFYQARARNADGGGGQWYSIPLNRGRRQVLELTLGGGMPVVRSERLDAAKQVAEQGSRVPAAWSPTPPIPSTAARKFPTAWPTPVRCAW